MPLSLNSRTMLLATCRDSTNTSANRVAPARKPGRSRKGSVTAGCCRSEERALVVELTHHAAGHVQGQHEHQRKPRGASEEAGAQPQGLGHGELLQIGRACLGG